MKLFRAESRSFCLSALFLILISALIYLPQIHQFGYYRDDWYYIMDGHFGGPQIFHEMFSIDRPARGYFFAFAYTLFGDNPIPYHLAGYGWHLGAAIAALWLFRMLWPDRNRFNFCMALLFLIFPGYLWWVAGIEYQPMMASLFFEVLSIALTIKGFQASRIVHKALAYTVSAMSGLIFVALVEYSISMEFFRFLCIALLVNRETGTVFPGKIQRVFVPWLISATGSLVFLIWDIFVFESTRRATDPGIQLGFLQGSPGLTLAQWIIRFFESMLNSTISAWIIPFYQRFWGLGLKEMLIGLVAATLLALVFILAHHVHGNDPEALSGLHSREAVLVGFLGVLMGLVPIIAANRRVEYVNFSHYSLPVSLASAMLLAGFVSYLSRPGVQRAAFSILVAAATMTHFATATSTANETETLRTFWWQAIWRIPELRPGTTLAVTYPHSEIREDFDNVWGPANMIYVPGLADHSAPIRYELAATSLSTIDVQRVLSNQSHQWWKYRTHSMLRDFTKLLVLDQPAGGSCVQIVDGRWPVLSHASSIQVEKLAAYSKVRNIVLDADPVSAYPDFLGVEPEHGWCYYFEKVDLAVQRGDWSRAEAIADEAMALNLKPKDPVEWLPFLTSYAFSDRAEDVESLIRLMKKAGSLDAQVCRHFQAMAETGLQPALSIQRLIHSRFCHT